MRAKLTLAAALAAGMAALAIAGPASAQQATEQYIPIGQSPGEGTMVGEVSAAVEPAAAGGATTFTMASEAGAPDASYVIGPHTRIYVDRSAQGLPNTLGAAEDVQPGRVVEVRIGDAQTRVAAWIKVRAQ